MKIHPENNEIPISLKTNLFLIRLLQETDVELDYKAVIANRKFLLTISNGHWPSERFTIEDNRQDLIQHEQEHNDGEAFTFTIMNPTESECLGCIYIHSLKPRLAKILDLKNKLLQNLGNFSARVHFWLIPSVMEANLQKILLDSLITWFKTDWVFSLVAFIIGPNNTELFDTEIIEEHFEFLCSEKIENGENRFYSLKM